MQLQETLKPYPERTDCRNAVPMAKLDPKSRIRNFSEVALGYTEKEAVLEAQRCLTCPKPQCAQGCPVGLEIQLS
jgi:glutamate synthase (NADPH/NADH) small chain